MLRCERIAERIGITAIALHQRAARIAVNHSQALARTFAVAGGGFLGNQLRGEQFVISGTRRKPLIELPAETPPHALLFSAAR